MKIKSNIYSGVNSGEFLKALLLAIGFLLIVNSAPATQITWTNSRSGNWEAITNWSPRQVPGPNDTAIISTSVTVTNTASESVLNLNLTMGTIVGSFPLVVSGQCNFTNAVVASQLEIAGQGFASGTLDLSGVTTVDTNAVLILTNAIFLTMGNYNRGNGLTNHPVLQNNGTVLFKPASFTGISVTIQNVGDWEDLGNETFNEVSGTNSFVNLGIYNKSSGTSATTFGTGWLFTTTGTIDTETGSLFIGLWVGTNILNGTLNWSGGTLLPGATLEITTNSTLNLLQGDVSGSLTVDLGGVLTLVDPMLGSYNFTSHLTNTVTLTNNGLVIATGQSLSGYNMSIQNHSEWTVSTNFNFFALGATNFFINSGLLADAGANVIYFDADWRFQTTGTIDTAAGSLSASDFYGTNVLSGTLALSNSIVPAGASLEITTNATLNWQRGDLNGTLTVDAGGTLNAGWPGINAALSFGAQNHTLKLTNISSMINSGAIRWSNSITAYNAFVQNNGSWETDVSSQSAGSSIQSTNLFLNSGLFQADAGSYSAFDNTWIMTNSGTINLMGGMYLRTLTQNAGATILNGGGTFLSSALFLGGTLSGVGTITGNVTNSATISPGTPVGTLNITGNFTQTGSGTMDIYLGGPSSGVDDSEIVVMGTIQTGGQLAVFLTNNFVPALEATYTFLRANGGQEIIFPDFSSLLFPTNIANLSLSLDPSPFGMLSLYVRMPVGPTFYNGNFVAQLMGIPGTNYTIEATSSLSPSDWQKVTNVTAGTASEGLAGVIQIDDPAVSTNRFYRAVTPAY